MSVGRQTARNQATRQSPKSLTGQPSQVRETQTILPLTRPEMGQMRRPFIILADQHRLAGHIFSVHIRRDTELRAAQEDGMTPWTCNKARQRVYPSRGKTNW